MSTSKYPNALDDSSSLPVTTDLVTPVRAEVVNRLRDAVLAVEAELGINPSAIFGTVDARLDDIDSRIGTVESNISGDFGTIQDALDAHVADISNPHGVTAAQVGAPTITDLTSHTSDTSNPHGVTAAQAGAPNKLSSSTDEAIMRYSGTSGQMQDTPNGPFIDDDGRLRLTETIDPSNIADNGFVYTKDVGGITELFYIDSDGNTTQVTAAGGSPVTGTGTDNTVVRWDGTNAVQDSGISIDDSDNLSGATSISAGSTPTSTTGAFNMGVNDFLAARNATNTSDITLVQVQGDNSIFGSTLSPGAVLFDAGAGQRIDFRPNAAGQVYSFQSTGFYAAAPLIQFLEDVASPIINQADEDDSVGSQTLLIHAQDNTFAASTGGDIDIRPGSGISANGQLALQDGGGTDRVWIVDAGDFRTNSPTDFQLQVASGIVLRGTSTAAQVYKTNLQFQATVVSPVLEHQVDGFDDSTGDTLTINSQDVTGGGTAIVGGALLIRAGDSDSGSATSRTGGGLTLRPGAGQTANGLFIIQDGGGTNRFAITSGGDVNIGGQNTTTLGVTANPNGLQLNSANAIFDLDILFTEEKSSPTIYQLDEDDAVSSQTLTIHAQDNTFAASTGGNLELRAGSGISTGGQLELQDPGGTMRFRVIEDGDVEVDATNDFNVRAVGTSRFLVNGTAAYIGTNTLQFYFGQVSPTIRQDDDANNSITGDTLTIHAQDCTGTSSTGGDLVLRPGSGTSANGQFIVQDGGGNDRLTLSANGGAYTISLLGSGNFDVSIGGTPYVQISSAFLTLQNNTDLRWTSGSVDPVIYHDDDTAGGATGDTLTIHAQNATGTSTTGGDLTLNAGSGTSRDGYVNIGTTNTHTVNIGDSNTIISIAGTIDNATYNTDLVFAEDVLSPTLYQITEDDVDTSQTLTIHAQDNTFAASTGGNLYLRAGTGTSTDGELELQDANGTAREVITSSGDIQLAPATSATIFTGGSQRVVFGAAGIGIFNDGIIEFDSASSTPEIRQEDDSSASATGDTFTISAQDVTGSGAAVQGGTLRLEGGDADAATASSRNGGDVVFRAGNGQLSFGDIQFEDGAGTLRMQVRALSAAAGGELRFVDLQSLVIGADVSDPFIYHEGSGTNDFTGSALTIVAQDVEGGGTTITGGALRLRGGSAAGSATNEIGGNVEIKPGSGTTTGGELELQDAGGTPRCTIDNGGDVVINSAAATTINIASTARTTITATEALFNVSTVQFDDITTAPTFTQQTSGSATTGQTLTIHAQDLITASGTKVAGDLLVRAGDCSDGTSNTGGSLYFRAGTGSDSNGLLELQDADGIDRLTINDTDITINYPTLQFDVGLEELCFITKESSANDGYTLFVSGQSTTGTSTRGGGLALVGGNGSLGTNASGGDVVITGGSPSGSGTRGNVSFHGSPSSWQSGEAIVFVQDADTVPTGDPSGGGFMYSDSGAGKWRGSSGTITTFGPADPRCERCGLDFVVDAGNPTEGWHKTICLNCLMKALTKAGINPGEYVIKDMEN